MTEQHSPTEGAIDGGFATLGLDERLLAALTALGYEEPTPIQREAIPPFLEGHDILGMAATGTGKTAAFALPVLSRIAADVSKDGDGRDGVRALILVPTRELAMQVAEAVHKYGKALGVRVLAVYGGQAIQQQLRALSRGVHVVVATPGRALDLVRRGSLELDAVRAVVLDEADEMLDMGFAEDLEAILEAVPEERQSALFSATMPPRIAHLAERHLKDPVRVTIAREVVAPGSAPKVRQVAYIVQRRHKAAALGRVLDMESPTSAIIFCRTRTEVDELNETLSGRGWRAEALHGGISQEQRDRVMKRFRDGTTELLVATDVAARGLDIEHLSHVVNYDVPSAPAAYVHRIGRTGRAGREGVAITLAEPREHRQLRNIEHLTKQKIAVEPVPTLVDLRARRLELTRASLSEAVEGGELEAYRELVESLAEEHDIMDLAAAAVKLAHLAAGGSADDEAEEIPATPAPRDRGDRPARAWDDRRPREGRERGDRGDRAERPARDRGERPERGDRAERGPRFERVERGDRPERGERPRRGREPGGDSTRLYVGLGRKAGVRPADLVGAIANEAGVNPRDIGAIEITEKFSLVEVPNAEADEIVSALRSTTIRGKKPIVRRDRDGE